MFVILDSVAAVTLASAIQKYKIAKVQKCKNTKMQKYKNTKIQKYKNISDPWYRGGRDTGFRRGFGDWVQARTRDSWTQICAKVEDIKYYLVLLSIRSKVKLKFSKSKYY